MKKPRFFRGAVGMGNSFIGGGGGSRIICLYISIYYVFKVNNFLDTPKNTPIFLRSLPYPLPQKKSRISPRPFLSLSGLGLSSIRVPIVPCGAFLMARCVAGGKR